MIMPSLKKNYQYNEYQASWIQAKEALNKATDITFVGYSLPDADEKIIELIQTIRPNIDRGKTNALCILGRNTDNSTLNRWLKLLGNNIKIEMTNAEDYYSQTSTNL